MRAEFADVMADFYGRPMFRRFDNPPPELPASLVERWERDARATGLDQAAARKAVQEAVRRAWAARQVRGYDTPWASFADLYVTARLHDQPAANARWVSAS